jgi:hypothetical protein
MAEDQSRETDDEKRRDPVTLTLIVVLILAYGVGQWLTFSTLAAKLDVIEQRINDNAARADAKAEALQDVVVRATQTLKKGQANLVVRVQPAPSAAPAASASAAPAPAPP